MLLERYGSPDKLHGNILSLYLDYFCLLCPVNYTVVRINVLQYSRGSSHIHSPLQ